jgi:hypothetical protein
LVAFSRSVFANGWLPGEDEGQPAPSPAFSFSSTKVTCKTNQSQQPDWEKFISRSDFT